MVWPVFLLTIIIPSVVAIYNGTTVTDPTIYPFFVMLGNPHVCGGVIISYNPPIVLTAAHCVADAHHPSTLPLGASNPYFAGFRGTDRRKHKINRIVDWVIHPSYMDVRGEIDMHYDIALIKLHVPIEPSSSVSRVALWPEQEELINPRQGVLMGFGYLGTADQDQANILQQMVLDVSRFSLASQEMIEAVTPLDFGWACHGDSGSPLVVYRAIESSSGKISFAPFAAGVLARIFGVHDPDQTRATCPIPYKLQSKVPTIIQSFCNISGALDWISMVTGFSKETLTDPFAVPECKDNSRHTQKNGGWDQSFKTVSPLLRQAQDPACTCLLY
ncbi:hypothetical protein VTP01DRAFT_1770 [Rhizomucor pusillus]|uniref:uncharacterized protein n=1 Tax=Rhizomucor pusillus TaxID=4840 RepID=UPI0037421C3C